MFDLFDLPLLDVTVAVGRVARAKSRGDHVAPRTEEEREHQESYRKRPLLHGSDVFNKLPTIAGIIFDNQTARLPFLIKPGDEIAFLECLKLWARRLRLARCLLHHWKLAWISALRFLAHPQNQPK